MGEPTAPRLEGFKRASDRRRAFAVARRLDRECGCTVNEIRQVTPNDYRIELDSGSRGPATVIFVSPEGTSAERAWCERVRDRGAVVEWADLRWHHRMVLREVG